MKRRLRENIEIGDRVFVPRHEYQGTVVDINGDEVLIDGPFGEEYHNLSDLEKLGGDYEYEMGESKGLSEARKKVIRLTESDIARIVKRVMKETLLLRGDDEDFKDIDKNKRSKYRWDVGNEKRFADDFKDEMSFVINNIKLAKDCEDLERSKMELENLENLMYSNNELTDGEVEHYSEVIEFYYEMINSELEEC
jgi:hypothetical protein